MYTFRTQLLALHFHYLLPLLKCPRLRPHFLDSTAHIEYVEYLTPTHKPSTPHATPFPCLPYRTVELPPPPYTPASQLPHA